MRSTHTSTYWARKDRQFVGACLVSTGFRCLEPDPLRCEREKTVLIRALAPNRPWNRVGVKGAEEELMLLPYRYRPFNSEFHHRIILQ